MEFIQVMKYIIENTNLYIEIDGQDPRSAADFGRAKSINLETQIIRFDRRESTKRRIGGESAWGQNIFLRTRMPFKDVLFALIRDWSIDDGSWEKWKMNEFKGEDYFDLYSHIRAVEINRNVWTRLKQRILIMFQEHPKKELASL